MENTDLMSAYPLYSKIKSVIIFYKYSCSFLEKEAITELISGNIIENVNSSVEETVQRSE